YVCNTIVATTRSMGKVALCVALSGIASLLLDGGYTAHSCFHIPIPIHKASTCRIQKNSDLHDVLCQTGIIIWNEAPMQHRHAIEALDHMLQDLMENA
ncbi:hypothetical protein HETIRDRAFT_313929, partial [Heterobasidion irregulare TC 32-1]